MVSYLKYLFIFYNNEIKDDELKRILDNEWGWGSLIKNAYENEDIESITIITYNYDIFLERILHLLNLEFQMVGFDTNSSKLRLIKPHGSISFRSKRTTVRDSFSIKYNRDSLGGGIEDLIVDEEVDFENISSINTMIPPSGESERYKLMWASTLREEVKETVNTMTEDDDVIFGGLSYCNVDRPEIDSIITGLSVDTNVKIINPNTNNTFVAVVSSVFDQYIHYTSTEIIGGLYRND